MITFYGYAVMKDGKFLGFSPRRNKNEKIYIKKFYKRPMFPCVHGLRENQERNNGHLGKVVRVKLTMEEEVLNEET